MLSHIVGIRMWAMYRVRHMVTEKLLLKVYVMFRALVSVASLLLWWQAELPSLMSTKAFPRPFDALCICFPPEPRHSLCYYGVKTRSDSFLRTAVIRRWTAE